MKPTDYVDTVNVVCQLALGDHSSLCFLRLELYIGWLAGTPTISTGSGNPYFSLRTWQQAL